MTLVSSFRHAHGLVTYLPLNGGSRAAQPTGWGSGRGSYWSDTRPTPPRSASPFRGEVKRSAEFIA
jgi:hypothetical protein